MQALDCYQTEGVKVRVEPKTIHTTDVTMLLCGIYLLGRGTARSSNQAPNNAIDTKQKAHKQE